MYKLGHFVSGQWVEHCYAAQFEVPEDENKLQRIVVGVPNGNPAILEQLADLLTPPYFLLYILHTPRGEGNPGRYQSPALSREQLKSFLSDYAQLLSGDARFDIWVHSRADNATLVWDRHNCIYAYGDLQSYKKKLGIIGFTQGAVSIPAPHEHRYRGELDLLANEVLQAFDWIYSPLQPTDEQ